MFNYLPLRDAVYKATGTRPHLSTIHRWCVKGSRGVRLESKVLGGRRFTTIDAVEHFINSLTELCNGLDEAPMETPKQAERRAQKAAEELARRLAQRKRK